MARLIKMEMHPRVNRELNLLGTRTKNGKNVKDIRIKTPPSTKNSINSFQLWAACCTSFILLVSPIFGNNLFLKIINIDENHDA